MQAFISDLHGNLAALEAVIEQMRRLGVSRIGCLGDVVGYGPNPLECIAHASSFEFCLKGNHEAALFHDAEDFNPPARAALEWTREQIQKIPEEKSRDDIWAWLGGRPESIRLDRFLCVHGTPRDPVREYLLPQDIQNTTKMHTLFAAMGEQRICCAGHSHLPGIYTEGGRYVPAGVVSEGFPLREERIIVNVGSVGQPRDGDPRACFATWDGERIRFHRVQYDVERTINKMLSIGRLPKILALRLMEGR